MASKLCQHIGAEAGQVFYAFPINMSMADWAVYRVLLSPRSVVDGHPDEMIYEGLVDTSISGVWLVYEGASQPAWYDWIAVWESDAQVAVLPSFGRNLSSRRGGDEYADVIYLGEQVVLARFVELPDGTPVDLSGKDLTFIVERENSMSKYTATGVDIVISGPDDDQYAVTIPSSLAVRAGETLHFALRDTSSPHSLYDMGKILVEWAPTAEPG